MLWYSCESIVLGNILSKISVTFFNPDRPDQNWPCVADIIFKYIYIKTFSFSLMSVKKVNMKCQPCMGNSNHFQLLKSCIPYIQHSILLASQSQKRWDYTSQVHMLTSIFSSPSGWPCSAFLIRDDPFLSCLVFRSHSHWHQGRKAYLQQELYVYI